MPEIRLRTSIAAPLDDCFTLSLTVDAHAQSMSKSRERVIDGVASGVMALGQTVTWQARHFGLPFRMTSKITEFDRAARFVDEQTEGPFALWWHEHRFEEEGSGTLMTDVVRFRSPLGPLGRIVDRLALTRYMTKLLVTRNAWLKTSLEGE